MGGVAVGEAPLVGVGRGGDVSGDAAPAVVAVSAGPGEAAGLRPPPPQAPAAMTAPVKIAAASTVPDFTVPIIPRGSGVRGAVSSGGSGGWQQRPDEAGEFAAAGRERARRLCWRVVVADESGMNSSPERDVQQTADWQAGYDTALADVIAIVDAMRGPTQSNLSAPILLRIRVRLLDLCASRTRSAA